MPESFESPGFRPPTMHVDDFRFKRDWDPTGLWRHGDVFPLPLPGHERWLSPSPAVLQLSASSLRQLRRIVCRLNELASYRINPRARPPAKLPRRVRATRHQAEVIDDIGAPSHALWSRLLCR